MIQYTHFRALRFTWINIRFIALKVIVIGQGFEAALVVTAKCMSSMSTHRHSSI